MKKILKLSLILVFLLSLLPLAVFADFFEGTPSPFLDPRFGTLINFDDQPTGNVVDEFDYVHLGVASIKNIEEGWPLWYRDDGPQSPPNYVGTGPGGERGTDSPLGWDGTILIELIHPTNQIGIGIANSKGGPEEIMALASDFTVVERIETELGPNDRYFVLTSSNWDIKYLKIYGDFFAIDDLQFNSKVLDIKPGTDKNKINLKSRGKVKVALLTTSYFDAFEVDPASVIFAGADPLTWLMDDVDLDGDVDILFSFKIQDLDDLNASSTEASIVGEISGDPFEFTDSVTIKN
ncbi:MAG: hypothetical protein GTO18_16940 [Anaerolineales bacterium]|nr:hypothetical protein [Anaerolineales bacterium]